MIDPSAIRRTTLENGLMLVSERISTVRSASIGVWVKMGSRDESEALNGVTHFLEHMLFKGTLSRNTRQIAVAIDSMGGQLDAFTSRENACYYAMVLDEHLADALDLLADLVTNPRLNPEELERERGVVLEEIASAEDDPEDLLFETFLSRFWSGHPMGRPILGTRDTVRSFTPDLLRHQVRAIAPGDLLVAAAGNLHHEELEALVREHFGALPELESTRERVAPSCQPHFTIIPSRDLEQVQLYVACEAPSTAEPVRYGAHVFNTLLGGSVSSRLFQSIREERGLAYSVYSSLSGYSDTGYLWISAGTGPESVPLVFELIVQELDRLRQEPIAPDELARVKEHLKGGLMLSLENTFGRMANLARQEMTFGRTFSLDEILAGIDAVSIDDVQSIANRLFDPSTLSAGLIARRQVADELRSRYADGLRLPDGARLCPDEGLLA